MPTSELVIFSSAIAANGVINGSFGDLEINSRPNLRAAGAGERVKLTPSQHLACFAPDSSSREPKNFARAPSLMRASYLSLVFSPLSLDNSHCIMKFYSPLRYDWKYYRYFYSKVDRCSLSEIFLSRLFI